MRVPARLGQAGVRGWRRGPHAHLRRDNIEAGLLWLTDCVQSSSTRPPSVPDV